MQLLLYVVMADRFDLKPYHEKAENGGDSADSYLLHEKVSSEEFPLQDFSPLRSTDWKCFRSFFLRIIFIIALALLTDDKLVVLVELLRDDDEVLVQDVHDLRARRVRRRRARHAREELRSEISCLALHI